MMNQISLAESILDLSKKEKLVTIMLGILHKIEPDEHGQVETKAVGLTKEVLRECKPIKSHHWEVLENFEARGLIRFSSDDGSLEISIELINSYLAW